MTDGLHDRLGELARRQHGVVTRPQLLDLGLREGAIDRRLRSGAFRRLHRGVYLVGPILLPRTRAMAAVLACRPAAWLSEWSASQLWGLTSSPEDDTAPVHVIRIGGSSRDRPGIRVRRLTSLPQEDRAELDGIPVTSPARTLLDLAVIAPPRDLERAVARADREGLVTRSSLRELVGGRKGQRGIPALRAVLERTGGPALTRSEAEDRFLRLVRKARLPSPEANARVGPYELDFLWRDQGIAVEVDGYRFHSSRTRFEGDRRRATRLAALGVQVIPLTWRQIVEEGMATAVQVGQALLRAELARAVDRE